MNLFFEFVFYVSIILIPSWAEREINFEIEQPSFLYKTSRSRQTLFRTTHVRSGSAQCIVGESVDAVDEIQTRGQFPCPSKYAVQKVNYSVVFHEEESRDLSIRPYWTILLDMEIDPMAIGSLTGFLFRYRSLDSMHELYGETGFVYLNTPLSHLESNVAKQIALKSPYRNKDNFEIQICPLPFCISPNDDSTSSDRDCMKLNVQIPDKQNEDIISNAIELPFENHEICEHPSVMTSSVETTMVTSFYLITTIPESATHDVIILGDVNGNLIAKRRCPVQVTRDPVFAQKIVGVNDEKFFKECTEILDMTSQKVLIWTRVKILGFGGIAVLSGLFLGIMIRVVGNCFKQENPMKRKVSLRRNNGQSDSKTAIYMHDSTLDDSDDNVTACSNLENIKPKSGSSICVDSKKLQEMV